MENILIREVGSIPVYSFTPLDHVAIGEKLGSMDFALGAQLAGARFVVLSGQLAKLERAIAAFMLATHTTEFGYLETLPPTIVNTKTMTGLGSCQNFLKIYIR